MSDYDTRDMETENPIRAYLKRKGIPLKELAARANLPANTLSRLACGHRLPRPTTARRLSEATGGEITYGLKPQEQ